MRRGLKTHWILGILSTLAAFFLLFFVQSSQVSQSKAIVEATPTITPQAIVETFPVTNVIDGDTITVQSSDSGKITVRFIGINAPEKNACQFTESQQRVKELIGSGNVGLVADPTQGDLDKYQRSLRYVRLADGSDLGKTLISEGLAKEYTYNKPYELQLAYREAERLAKAGRFGMWSLSCTTQSTEPKEGCDCSKTCSVLSCEEAQFQLQTCGCTARDGDGNGVACGEKCG